MRASNYETLRAAGLLLALTAIPLASCQTPLMDLFKEVEQTPILMYQCYRNKSSFEPDDAVAVTAYLNGTGQPALQCNTTLTFTTNGTDLRTSIYMLSKYSEENDAMIATAEDKTVEITLTAPPYNDKAYLFKQCDRTNDEVAYKIYDRDESCENAQVLRKQVCGDDCNLLCVK